MTDGPRLRQMFDNLIERAVRQTRRGCVEASLVARRVDGGVMLEGRVRDSGDLLSPEKLARIFEPNGSVAVDGHALATEIAVREQRQFSGKGGVGEGGQHGGGGKQAFHDLSMGVRHPSAPVLLTRASYGRLTVSL